MIKIRSNRTLSGMAISWGLVMATTGSGQTGILSIQVDGKASFGTAIQSPIKAAPQHLGKGPIDLNNLPQDILDCDVCRQRLGLPPRKNHAGFQFPQLPVMPQPQIVPQPQIAPQLQVVPQPQIAPQIAVTPQAGSGRILGSPGMMSSIVAEQMAQQGYVVEEFKPPQPEQNSIQLGSIPPEARQQFLRSLNLPQGARVMSAEIKRHEASNTNTSLSDRTSRKEGSLGAPGIVSQPETITPKSETVELGTTADKDDEPTDNKLESETIPAPMQRPTPESQPQPQSTPQPTSQPQPTPQVDTAAREQLLLEQTIDQLQKKLEVQAAEQGKLNAMLERLQSESQKRMERADAANREALTMLEKRTAEVTELQLKLKSQQAAMEKMELKSKESNDKRPEPSKDEAKKREQNKGNGKKPNKPSGDA